MRIVLDANVLLSGLVEGASPPALILRRRVVSNLTLVTSEHILGGVRSALRKPYWQGRPDHDRLQSLLATIVARMSVVEPAADVHGVAEDEEDDLVLATAVAAGADYLVTGDHYLLEIGEFRGIPIVSPRAFLDRLDQEPA